MGFPSRARGGGARLRYHPLMASGHEADGEAASSRFTLMMVLYVVLPMVVVSSVWLWIRHERSKVRDMGFGACLSAGREATWCNAQAETNHERCMELTFRPGTRTSGRSFDGQGYVECLELGDLAYWKL